MNAMRGPHRLSGSAGAALAALCAATTIAAQLQPASPFAAVSGVEAERLARAQQRVAVLAFYAVDCPGCPAWDRTFADPRVLAWIAANAIAARVFDDPALAARHAIVVRPTVVVIAAYGEVLDQFDSHLDADGFLAAVAEAQRAHATRRATRAVEDRLEAARAAAARGEHATATDDLLWVLEHSPGHRPEADAALRRLLAIAPAVRGTLERHRDRATTLLADQDDAVRAAEVAALDAILGDLDHLGDLALRVQALRPQQVATLTALCTEPVQEHLVAAGRFAEFLRLTGDPLPAIETRWREQQSPKHRPQPGQASPALRHADRCFRALLGSGQADDARDVADYMLGFEPSATAHLRFILAAAAAGRRDLATAILADATRILPESELAELRAATGERR